MVVLHMSVPLRSRFQSFRVDRSSEECLSFHQGGEDGVLDK